MAHRFAFSRRRLMHGAAAVVAAPLIVPARALGRDGAAPAGARINLGFVGVGTQGRGHVNHFAGSKDVQVVAVCDVDTSRRKHAQDLVDKKYAELERREYRGCAGYVDYRELLARPDVDGVVIATPDHWHAAVAIDACKAKKDVYCEKPLTMTIAEAKRVMDVATKHERVFQTGSQQRSSAEFRKAVELVRNGRIGQLLSVHVGVGGWSRPCDLPGEPSEPGLDWDRWLGPTPERPYNSVLSPRGVHTHYPAWRDYREFSGGAMTDSGAHHFDIAQWGLDADRSGPVEIHPPRDERSMRGLRLVYETGVYIVHGGPSGITFNGNDGLIYVDRGRIVSEPESILKQPLTNRDTRVYESNDHHANWLQCIRTRKQPIANAEVGARSATVCHLGVLGYMHRRVLRWDPQKWEFPGDAEANGWRAHRRREPYRLPEA